MLCLLFNSINAQNAMDFSFARSLQNAQEKEVYTFDFNYQNELVAFTNLLFVSYKSFISSQDYNSCVFHPSCSVYAMESIKKHGFILGFMGSFDRMVRCNGLSINQYEIDFEKGLALDPVP
jgi:uncharacterized protein